MPKSEGIGIRIGETEVHIDDGDGIYKFRTWGREEVGSLSLLEARDCRRN